MIFNNENYNLKIHKKLTKEVYVRLSMAITRNCLFSKV